MSAGSGFYSLPGIRPLDDGFTLLKVSGAGPSFIGAALSLLLATAAAAGDPGARYLGRSDRPSWSPDGEWIGFHSTRDGNYEIYLMRSDGSGLKRLTENPWQDLFPVFSSDGQRILFASNREGWAPEPRRTQIYSMAFDGGDVRDLTRFPYDWDDPLKPAANNLEPFRLGADRIGFLSDRGGGWHEIYSMAEDGSDPVRITYDGAHHYNVFASADGRWIYFDAHRDGRPAYVGDGGWDLRRIPSGGGPWEDATADADHETYDGALSPDGTMLLFKRAGSPGLWRMKVNEGVASARLLIEESAFSPAWSPDGGRIAFVSERDGNREIYVSAADGSRSRRLTVSGPGTSGEASSTRGQAPEIPADDDGFPILEPHRLLRTWTGASPGEAMGFKVRDVGDVDGDRVNDFAVASTSRANGRMERAGAIDVFSTATGRLLHSYPGHLSGGHFGNAIGPAGDVDGDGINDVVAGASDGKGEHGGYAVVFSAASGLTHHVLRSGKRDDLFGIQAHGAGDLDGDGHDDVVVGAPADDAAGPAAGRAYYYSGRTGDVLFTLEGEHPGDAFGSAVAGDVHDGSGLFAVGAREAGPEKRGRVYVYRMKGDRPARVFAVEAIETSRELGAYFLSFLGDVDADGTPDLYASDYADSGPAKGTGRVRVVSGRTGKDLIDLEGRSVDGGFGTGYGRVGDVDGDGHADVLVGSWRNSDGAEAGGRAFLFAGRDGRLLSTYTGRFPGRTLGHDAIGIGDVNGDGIPDLLITNAGNSGVLPRAVGHVYLFAGPGTMPQEARAD